MEDTRTRDPGPPAVVLDMDGVLIDSEQLWHEVRRDYAARFGGRWTADDQRAVMGANSLQWARHIRERFGVPLSPEDVIGGVVALLLERYAEHLPLLPGAVEAVRRLAEAFPLGLASSSPARVIEWVLGTTGLEGCFRAWVSSDEVARGKPAPDVYLLALQRLGAVDAPSVAVEDSGNGIEAAHRAGMGVIAVPNQAFPPGARALDLADVVVVSLAEVTPDLVRRAAARRPRGAPVRRPAPRPRGTTG